MYKRFNTQLEAQSFIDAINKERGYNPDADFNPETMPANNYANPIEGADGWYVPLDSQLQEEHEGVEVFERKSEILV